MEQEQSQTSTTNSLLDQAYAELRAAGHDSSIAFLERLYSDPAQKLAEARKALAQTEAIARDAVAASAQRQADQKARDEQPHGGIVAAAPAAATVTAATVPPVSSVAPTTKPRRRAPTRLDDPGLTAVVDSRLAPGFGGSAVLVWLCLLRHANGRTGRLVQKIGYTQIQDGTGLSLKKIRSGLAVLLAHGLVQRTKEGRTTNGAKLTAEYVVPFPTPARIERWLIQAQSAEKAVKTGEQVKDYAPTGHSLGQMTTVPGA